MNRFMRLEIDSRVIATANEGAGGQHKYHRQRQPGVHSESQAAAGITGAGAAIAATEPAFAFRVTDMGFPAPRITESVSASAIFRLVPPAHGDRSGRYQVLGQNVRALPPPCIHLSNGPGR
jgi:hypothetical protein